LKNLKSATKASGHLIFVGSARLLLEDDMSGAEKEVIVKINHGERKSSFYYWHI